MVAQDWMPLAGAQLSKLEPSDTGIFNTIKINSRVAATAASRTASSMTRCERDTEHLRHAPARVRDTQRKPEARSERESEARSRKGTGGRLNGISRAHTAGRVLEGTSGPGGELHGSSEVAGGELAGTSDSSDEPDGTGGRLNGTPG